MITGDLWTDITTLVSTPKEGRGAFYAALQDYPREYRQEIFDIADRLLSKGSSHATGC